MLIYHIHLVCCELLRKIQKSACFQALSVREATADYRRKSKLGSRWHRPAGRSRIAVAIRIAVFIGLLQILTFSRRIESIRRSR